MKPDVFSDSASGLRPASAFVVIAFALGAIGIWVARLALRPSSAPRPHVEQDPSPEYAIVDREGRPLAQFVQRLDLVVSPNALWQAHTPERLLERLGLALGGRFDRAELAHRLMPDAVDGVVRTRELLREAPARALDAWIRRGTAASSPEGEPPQPIDGLWLERASENAWRLCWRPEVALSLAARARHVPRDDKNPLRWSRKLADGIARCLWGADALGDGDDETALDAQRERVWRLLMPTTYTVAVRGFDAAHAPRLFQLLSDEGVLHVQMHIARERDRVYPFGPQRLCGAWGYLDRAAAEVRARKDLGLGAAAAVAPELADELADDLANDLDRRTRDLCAVLHPLTGLELLGARTLAAPEWAFLEREGASYVFERHTPPRRKEPRIVPRSYYVDSSVGSDVPQLVTTLDAYLQREVGRRLDLLMQDHEPALAMAIVVDVQSGDVLALDSREAYPFAAFAPIRHTFTPGSTAKVLVMAAALDQGVVSPEEIFDVGNGKEYRLSPSRTIHEAENPELSGRVSAAQVLAYSINAGMVQIGPRVQADVLRAYFLALGYSQAPSSGLGPESTGRVPPLPWKRVWEHASVSFGHELMVTLWQHAAGLATVIRGGQYLPLRLVDAVQQDGERRELARPSPRPVFRPDTCEKVRAMMQLGAEMGTGKPVARRALLPELDLVGTKTGTAEKVPDEVCLHVELAHQDEHHRERTRCSKACRRALKGKRVHRSCYTSSMCAFGRASGDGREIMVLVVADEPRKGKYGSRVAGPTAIAILQEALGVTELGEVEVPDLVLGFAPSTLPSVETSDAPWAHTGSLGKQEVPR